MAFVSDWDFSHKHIDSSLSRDNFISASRAIIYAAPYDSASGSAANFHRVGVIQGYSWGEQRQVEMVFEIGSDVPYLIPGRTYGNLSLSRILVFGKDMVNVMYYEGALSDSDKYIRSLKEITASIDMMFAAYDMSTDQQVYSRVFQGCWLTSRSESISAGQTLVAENVSIVYEDVVGASIAQ
jgi:hypothetical protein